MTHTDCPTLTLTYTAAQQLATSAARLTKQPWHVVNDGHFSIADDADVACYGYQALYTATPECKRDVLGDHWTVCRAPGDGPCYCDVVVRSISATDDKPGIETEPPEPPVYPQDNGKLLADIAQVIDMALGRTHGGASIVTELYRLRAEVQGLLGTYVV